MSKTNRQRLGYRVSFTAAVIVGVLAACPAFAGMPHIEFSDVVSLRVQAISFFAFTFLLLSGAVMKLWNWLRKDFPNMPLLSYRRALGLVGLWAALFVLILTMISGARELLTPGAWEKDGAIYKLKDHK